MTYAKEVVPRLAALRGFDICGGIFSYPLAPLADYVDAGTGVVLSSRFDLDLTSVRIIRKEIDTADVIYVPTEIPTYPYREFVGALRNLKTIYGPHLDRHSRLRRDTARHLLARVASSRATGYIAPSNYAADLARTYLLNRPKKTRVKVVYHGASTALRTAVPDSERRNEFVLVGNLGVHKNIEVVIDALRIGLPNGTPLAIAGRVARGDLDRLRDAAGDRVHVLGSLEHFEVLERISRAKVLIYPSIVESFGNPLAEALAAGTPIVAADAPINREICGDAAAYFSPVNAEDLLVQLQSIEGGGKLGAAPRVYSWQKCAEDTAGALASFTS